MTTNEEIPVIWTGPSMIELEESIANELLVMFKDKDGYTVTWKLVYMSYKECRESALLAAKFIDCSSIVISLS